MTDAVMTRSQAKRYANHLAKWGYDNIEVTETFPQAEVRVTALNRCGQRRVVRSTADFVELRELEASR